MHLSRRFLALPFLLLGALSSFPSAAAPLVPQTVSTSENVRDLVDQVLRQLDQTPAEGAQPVVMVLHDGTKDWGAWEQALVGALSRYGVNMEGFSAATAPSAAQLERMLAEASAPAIGFETEDHGTWWQRARARVAGFFGLQLARDHFRKLSGHYRGVESFRFRWLEKKKAVPRGFGGGFWKQTKYLLIAGSNTLAFYAVNSHSLGAAEALVFGLTYLYQASFDYINYRRQAGRVPQWQQNDDGSERLVTDVHKTFSRSTFFLVTWGVIAASNALIVVPLVVEDGLSSAGFYLWRVFSNSVLGVFSFAPIEALFALWRRKQLSCEEEARTLAKNVPPDETPAAQSEREAKIAQLKATAASAERWQMNGRLGYLGGVYPWIKNAHLLGFGWGRHVLTVIGTVGFFVDMVKNGTRLRALRGKKATPVAGNPPGEGGGEFPCGTLLLTGSREDVDRWLQSLAAPAQ